MDDQSAVSTDQLDSALEDSAHSAKVQNTQCSHIIVYVRIKFYLVCNIVTTVCI